MKKYNTPLHLLFEGGQVNPPFLRGTFTGEILLITMGII